MGRKVKKFRRANRRPALAILSRKKTLYSTRRLIEAAKARGFRTRVIDVLRCNLALESGNPRLYHRGKEVRGIGVAIPRIGASVTGAGLSVVRQLEAMGVPMINGAAAIARSRDKLAALQHLAAAGVRIPRTVLARGGGGVHELVAQVGGLPAVLKLIQGTHGLVELNSSPGFEGLERATGLDIAGEIVGFAAQVAEGARRVIAL